MMLFLKIIGYIMMTVMELVFAHKVVVFAKYVWEGIKEKSSFMVVWNTVGMIITFAIFLWIFHPRMLEDLFGWKPWF